MVASVCWFLPVWFSPFILVSGREQLAGHRIPGYLRGEVDRLGIDVYLVEGVDGYGFSCYLGWRRAIVIERNFFRFAQGPAFEFVMAHELAHHELGHVALRYWLTATGLSHFPAAHQRLQKTEDEANAWAERLTGFPRTVVWGVGLRKSEVGGPGHATEESEA